MHQSFPATAPAAALTLAAGFCRYGLSLTFFVLGLRHLGTARTGAYFGAAPFVGALLSILSLDEPFGWRLIAHDDGVAPAGTHTHRHRHAPLVHKHGHTPDLHHRHDH